MRIDPQGIPAIEPAATTTASAAPNAPPSAVDRVGSWAQNEWTTVVGAVHGLAAAPGVVSHAWLEAADANMALAGHVGECIDGWDRNAPEARSRSINALRDAAAGVSSTGSHIAHALHDANNASLPGASLPDALAAQARGAVSMLSDVAQAQRDRASTLLPSVSRVLRGSAADAHAFIAAIPAQMSPLAHLPIVGNVPVLSLALVAAGSAADSSRMKVPQALAANIGGAVAGTVAGDAITTNLAALGTRAVMSDVAAQTARAVAASGPVGWAVAGGVVGGAVIAYGVVKALESQPPRHLVDELGNFARGLTST